MPVPLRRLILLDVIHQHLQAAVDAAVIEVEAEAAHFNRFPAALVLPGVNPRGKLVVISH